jgi:hypothetical protein
VHSHIQAWNGLSEDCVRVKIGIGDAAISRPEAGVDGELGKIGESSHLPGPICFAARQLRERSQINWLGANRFQIITEESCVADLIIGVVMNVLRHVAIEELKGLSIGHVAPVEPADFLILSSTELRVLLP